MAFYGIGAIIRIGREIQRLLSAGFFSFSKVVHNEFQFVYFLGMVEVQKTKYKDKYFEHHQLFWPSLAWD